MDYLPKDPAILVSNVNILPRDEVFDMLESQCYVGDSFSDLLSLALYCGRFAQYYKKISCEKCLMFHSLYFL